MRLCLRNRCCNSRLELEHRVHFHDGRWVPGDRALIAVKQGEAPEHAAARAGIDKRQKGLAECISIGVVYRHVAQCTGLTRE